MCYVCNCVAYVMCLRYVYDMLHVFHANMCNVFYVTYTSMLHVFYAAREMNFTLQVWCVTCVYVAREMSFTLHVCCITYELRYT